VNELGTSEQSPWGEAPQAPLPPAIRARREAARSAARRRRLVLADVALGVVIAVVLLLIGFGLAPLGIVAVLVLAACGISYAIRRVRRTDGSR
jgi:hypothetical protein